MNQKEKALSMMAITEGAGERLACEKATALYLNSSMKSNDSQIKISDLLNRGAANAIPLRQLGRITGLDGRVIRRMVEKERRSGIPICSNTSTGFFLADSFNEVDAFVCQMRSRAREILKTADAVEMSAISCIEGEVQLKIWHQ